MEKTYMSFLGDLLDNIGTGLNLPELGISESITGGKPTTNTGRVDYAYGPTVTLKNGQTVDDGNYRDFQSALATKNAVAPSGGGSLGDLGSNLGGLSFGGGNSASAGGGGYAADVSYLDDQAQQLRDLLSRTDTGLNNGLTQIGDEYSRALGQSNADKERQYANYQDQRVQQNQGKLNTYDTINKNANNGFRSLSQIIGRAAGTGSSAFRDLLPNVIGTDTSSKRSEANETYGSNLQGIDKAQGQYDISFADVLDDLARQRKTQEESLRSGIEGQRQSLNGQLGTVAGQRAQALGGGYNQVRAAQQPFQDSINNSRNQVENFFNQFRTAYTPQQAVAATPELAGYTADRSVINAQNQGASDATNPYAALLRKRLTGTA